MERLIGYARVSTRQQDADRQVSDLLSASVRRDDIYTDHGVSGGRASRPAFLSGLVHSSWYSRRPGNELEWRSLRKRY